MERIQKLYKAGDKYELKLVPHWSTRFCEFDDELCDCNTQGVTKIGEWVNEPTVIAGTDRPDWWEYKPRKGYEHIDPKLSPRR